MSFLCLMDDFWRPGRADRFEFLKPVFHSSNDLSHLFGRPSMPNTKTAASCQVKRTPFKIPSIGEGYHDGRKYVWQPTVQAAWNCANETRSSTANENFVQSMPKVPVYDGLCMFL
jgi:hypothetical protein